MSFLKENDDNKVILEAFKEGVASVLAIMKETKEEKFTPSVFRLSIATLEQLLATVKGE